MAQGVGQIGGDAKGAAQANNVDILRFRQQRDRALQIVAGGLHRQLLQRLGIDHGEHIQDFGRRFRRGCVIRGGLAEQTRALGIVSRLFHQVLLEHLLHFVEAAKTKGVSEADQRGRGDVSLLRDRGHGVESHAIAVIENIAGYLFQAFA